MIKVGIVGTGMISELFAEGAKFVEGMEVVAIQSRDEMKAKEFAKKHEVELTFTDYEGMLKDELIDAVYIGLPNSLHFEYARKALSAKKITILEKPFLSNLKELDTLIDISEETRTMVFEMNRVLCLPNTQVIRDHLKDIAPVRMITMNFSQYSRKYNDLLAGKTPNVFSDEFSGGALVDLGVYGVHLMVDLFGMPNNITYIASQLPNSIDISGNLTLTYDGFLASLVQSKNSRCDNRITIQGEKGTIYASPTASRIDTVILDVGEKKDITVLHEYESMTYTLREIVRVVSEKDEETYRKQFKHIRNVLEVLCAARQSAGIKFTADQK